MSQASSHLDWSSHLYLHRIGTFWPQNFWHQIKSFPHKQSAHNFAPFGFQKTWLAAQAIAQRRRRGYASDCIPRDSHHFFCSVNSRHTFLSFPPLRPSPMRSRCPPRLSNCFFFWVFSDYRKLTIVQYFLVTSRNRFDFDRTRLTDQPQKISPMIKINSISHLRVSTSSRALKYQIFFEVFISCGRILGDSRWFRSFSDYFSYSQSIF